MPASYRNRPEAQQQKINELKLLAQSRGGKFLSTEYISNKTKYSWACAENHTWNSSVDSVKGQNSWCPKCAGNAPRSLEELREIIERRGGVLLSNNYSGVDSTYVFKCNLGHQNSNSFKKIESGQWCSTCNKTSKSEEITRAILQNLFESPFPKKRPSWLRNSRGRQMELDGYCEELGVAFEYQGIQHFKKIGLYGGDLPQRIADDTTKAKLCQRNKVRLLIFTYKDDFDEFHEIAKRQLKNEDDLNFVNFHKPVVYDDAFIRLDRLQELKDLLAPKQIQVLSKKWLKVDTLYSLRCLVCKTEWKSRANAYFNTRRVAGCDYCNRRQPANKKDLLFLQDFAKKHGGTALSKEYKGRRNDYEFICSKSHKFTANLNNLMHRNQFCPECEKREHRNPMPSLQELKATLSGFNLQLLSTPTKLQDETKVKCQRCGQVRSVQLRSILSSSQKCASCDPHPNKGRSGPVKISDIQAVEIRKRLGKGQPTSLLASEYGVSATTIRTIRDRL